MPRTTMRLLPALLAVFAGSASAAAFQLWEQNASGIGTAYAGSAAVADNASTIFFNPAGMALLSSVQTSVGVSAVRPRFNFRDQGSSSFGPVGGNGGDAGSWSALPNAYLSWQLMPELSIGLGVSSPFGLATEYEDSNWAGRFHSVKAKIKTVNLNPSLAYRMNDKVALGFGINYQRIDAELTNFTRLPVPNVGNVTVPSSLKGDDSAWGWNAGALFTLSPAMRVGLSYRSSIKYKVEGDQTVGTTQIPARAKIELPDTFIMSVWQQVSDRWEAMGDLSYTHWSTVNRLDVERRSDGALLGSETFGYRDAWRFAWGAAYRANDAWKVKFGTAYDRTPTTDSNRSPRVPDNNRLWLSVGGQWKAGKDATVDFGYAYLYLRDPKISNSRPLPSGESVTLQGKYSNSGHVLGIQYSQAF